MDIYGQVKDAYERYPYEKKIIGESIGGRAIFAFFVGRHEYPVGIGQYAMHAREWITALLALYHIERGVSRGGVWIVPLVNPDGALLSETGIGSVSAEHRAFLKELGGDYRLYKCNLEGVDLNLNFDARWGTGRGNLTYPAPHGYIGPFPQSAPESRALADFTREVQPDYTLSWHAKGEEIYWRFFQERKRLRRDKRLARLLAKSTGYALKETPHSSGGYKDWCIEKLKIPAFTIEVGNDRFLHPLGRERLGDIVVHCGNAVYDFTKGFCYGRKIHARGAAPCPKSEKEG